MQQVLAPGWGRPACLPTTLARRMPLIFPHSFQSQLLREAFFRHPILPLPPHIQGLKQNIPLERQKKINLERQVGPDGERPQVIGKRVWP